LEAKTKKLHSISRKNSKLLIPYLEAKTVRFSGNRQINVPLLIPYLEAKTRVQYFFDGSKEAF